MSPNTMQQQEAPSIRSCRMLVLLLLALPSVDSFAPLIIADPSKSLPTATKKTRLDMMNPFKALLDYKPRGKDTQPFSLDIFGNHFELPSLAASGSAVAVSTATSINIFDPIQEAHICTGLSHVALDLVAFFAPGLLALRLSAVAGRLLTMTADYLPDHSILPQEFFFQIFMLSVTCLGAAQAAFLPTLGAVAAKLSERDREAYRTLFEPAGATEVQYKALTVCSLDWVVVPAGEALNQEDDDFVYWLYQGEAQHLESRSGNVLYTTDHQVEQPGRRLFGERRLMRLLDKKRLPTAQPGALLSVRAVQDCTFLRIRLSKLKLLMNMDQQLSVSIRNLLFQGMEAKLDASWQRI